MFIHINIDPCILIYRQGNMLILVEVYLDDLVFAFQSQSKLKWLKSQLMNEFNIKDLGKAKMIIGWKISRDL